MRPSLYSDTLAESICLELAAGRSLRSVCKADELPAPATVYRWLQVHPEFAHMYVIARGLGADTIAGEILEIADGGGDVQRDRLRINARKWLLGKLAPKKYGRA